MKHLFLYLPLYLFLVIQISAQGFSEDVGLQCIGEIQPRHAREIESSNWSVGAETMDRDYTIYENWKDYLGPLGVKKARIQGGWAKTEREKGKYSWTWLDEIILDMPRQGVEPWVCLCYGNPLYSDGGGTRLGAAMPHTEDALKAWERWVAAFVERYKQYVDEWEIWNEPLHGKNNRADQYADLLIRTAQTIRSKQPDANIIAMAMAGIHIEGTQIVLQILGKDDKLSLVDEITYHPYSYNPDDSYKRVVELRETIEKYSSRITIRQGENGAPSERRKTKALSNYDWTELSQAKWALRRLLGDLGRDIPSSYFAIMDMKYPDEMNRKGLLHSTEDQKVDYPKPAYYAVQHLTSIFDNSLRRIPEYSYTQNGSRSLSLFAYENRSTGKQVVTIWFDDETPSNENTMTIVDFTFADGDFEEPVYVDLRTGRIYALPDSNWDVRGDKYEFRSIPCYDSPILISDRSNILMVDRATERRQ